MRCQRRFGSTPSRRGGALAFSLVTVFVVAVLAAAFLRLSAGFTLHNSQSVDRKRAFYLAEAGLAEAFSGVLFGKSGNVGSPKQPALFGEGLFWVEAQEIEEGMIELNSVGMCGRGRATLSMVVEPGVVEAASLGIFGSTDLVIPEGTLIDAYNSAVGPYSPPSEPKGKGEGKANGEKSKAKDVAARVGSNGDIFVRASAAGPTSILGDLVPGREGAVYRSGSPRITGSIASGFDVELPSIEAPSIPEEPGIVHENEMPLMIRSGEFGYEHIRVGAEADLVVQGPCTLLLDELYVAPGGSLAFDTTEGPVRVYVERRLELAEGSLVSTTDTDPSQVSLFYIGGREEARLHAEGQFHGQIMAPRGWVGISNTFEVFGSLVAGGLGIAPGSKLHFDENLTLLADEMAVPRFVTWRIVDFTGPFRGDAGKDPFKLMGLNRSKLRMPGDAHEDQFLEITYYTKCGKLTTYQGMESDFDWTDVDSIVGGYRGAGFASLTGTAGTMLVK